MSYIRREINVEESVNCLVFKSIQDALNTVAPSKVVKLHRKVAFQLASLLFLNHSTVRCPWSRQDNDTYITIQSSFDFFPAEVFVE